MGSKESSLTPPQSALVAQSTAYSDPYYGGGGYQIDLTSQTGAPQSLGMTNTYTPGLEYGQPYGPQQAYPDPESNQSAYLRPEASEPYDDFAPMPGREGPEPYGYSSKSWVEPAGKPTKEKKGFDWKKFADALKFSGGGGTNQVPSPPGFSPSGPYAGDVRPIGPPRFALTPLQGRLLLGGMTMEQAQQFLMQQLLSGNQQYGPYTREQIAAAQYMRSNQAGGRAVRAVEE